MSDESTTARRKILDDLVEAEIKDGLYDKQPPEQEARPWRSVYEQAELILAAHNELERQLSEARAEISKLRAEVAEIIAPYCNDHTELEELYERLGK